MTTYGCLGVLGGPGLFDLAWIPLQDQHDVVRDAGGDQLGGGVVDERHAVVANDFDLHGDAPSFLGPARVGSRVYIGLPAGVLQLFGLVEH